MGRQCRREKRRKTFLHVDQCCVTLQSNEFLSSNLTQINLQGRSASQRVLLSVMSSSASKELINDVNPVGKLHFNLLI